MLLGAIQAGVGDLAWETGTFAYAELFDASSDRYNGLRTGENISVMLDGNSVVVKPEAARRQLDADEAARQARVAAMTPPSSPTDTTTTRIAEPAGGSYTATTGTLPATSPPARPSAPTRFHGAVKLDPMRTARDAGRAADEVIAHLAALMDANVEITLEIHATVPAGVPEHVVRIVTENSRTLKFIDHGFEES